VGPAAVGQMALEGGEPLVPARADALDPGHRVLERLGCEAVANLAAAAGHRDEAGLAEAREVLRDRLPGDRQPNGELGRGRAAARSQHLDERTAPLVRERGEDRV